MRGSIVARGKGTWAVIIDLPRGEDGKRRQKWHTVHGTKKVAERELARILHEQNTGRYVEPSQETVATHLTRWLGIVAGTVGPSCLDRYRDVCRRHLIPRFGTVLLARLTPAMIADYYVWAGEQGGKGGKALSSQTVHHIGRTLRQALDVAAELGLLAQNPARRVKLPRPRSKRPEALTEDQVRAVLAAVTGGPLYALTVLALATGARRGELLALQWSDVDLDASVLTIRRSLEQSDAGVRVKAPKSAAGTRTLSLPPLAVKVLRQERAEQARRRLMQGDLYIGDSVFAQADGSCWSPDSISQRFLRAMTAAGVKGVSLHTLRHSYGSYLLAGGMPVNAVSAAMGHATAAMTLNRYAHLLGGEQEQAAVVIESMLSKAFASG